MQFLNRHILLLGGLFLVIFFVATSGFSVALTYCAMGNGNTCSMATADDDHDMSGACADHASPHGARQVAMSNNDTCMLTTVAGGLQTDPSTVEKQSVARNVIVKVTDMPAEAPVLVNDQRNYQNFVLFPSAASAVSPPSVEKYVLNATFLI